MRSAQAWPENPPNTWEWMTPRRAQASMVMGSSGTMGMCSVTRSPRFRPAEVTQQGGELVHPDVKLLVGDVLVFFGDGLGHEVDGGFVLVLAPGAGRCSCSMR